MKKIISITIIVILIIGAVFYFKISNKVEDKTINNMAITGMLSESDSNPEAIVSEIDKLEDEEAEIDSMIDELEELTF